MTVTTAHHTAPRKYNRAHGWLAIAALAAVVLAITLTVALWPRSMTVHGTQLDTSGTGALSTGTQVVIEAPDGSVIATGTLAESTKLENKANKGFNAGLAASLNAMGQGNFNPATVYTWTVAVPSESRYGIKIGNLAPYWVSQAVMAKGPVLTYGSG